LFETRLHAIETTTKRSGQTVRKKDVHDHLTEILPYCWVIAACQCYW